MRKSSNLQKLRGERGLNKTHVCMSLICETSGKVSLKDRNKRKRKSKSRLEMDSLLIHCHLVHIFVDKVYVARATVLPVRLGRVPCSGSRQIRNKNGAKWMSNAGTNHRCGSTFLQPVFPSMTGWDSGPLLHTKYPFHLYKVDKSVRVSGKSFHTLRYVLLTTYSKIVIAYTVKKFLFNLK